VFYFVQQHKIAERSEGIKDSLAAEWESFEKLIQGGQDEQLRQETTEQDGVSMWSSDHSKKPAVGGHAPAQPLEVRQKRVFREDESDSDGNSNSDSEDDSRPTLPSAGMSSASKYEVDQRSSSSDSSQSAKNKFGTKSGSSDSDSSSDDEKPTEQAKVQLGKCDASDNSEFV